MPPPMQGLFSGRCHYANPQQASVLEDATVQLLCKDFIMEDATILPPPDIRHLLVEGRDSTLHNVHIEKFSLKWLLV